MANRVVDPINHPFQCRIHYLGCFVIHIQIPIIDDEYRSGITDWICKITFLSTTGEDGSNIAKYLSEFPISTSILCNVAKYDISVMTASLSITGVTKVTVY